MVNTILFIIIGATKLFIIIIKNTICLGGHHPIHNLTMQYTRRKHYVVNGHIVSYD